ncbi:MAG: glycosyltransferase family 4 protein [Phycisphaerae bacterium]|nr:glycosyltransferase family 4 protein [Phycisphaerae bacterium]
MRVAIVHEGSDPRRGGAETSIVEMAEALSRRGIDVTLVDRGPQDVRYAVKSGGGAVEPGEFRRVRLPAPGATKLARLRAFVEAVEAHTREAKYDIVHAVTPMRGADVYQPRGGTYPETIRRTLAITRNPLWRGLKSLLRRLNGRQQFLMRLEREMLLATDGPTVACVSDYVARQIAQDYPAAAGRARVVFNGVSMPREAATESSPRTAGSGPRLLFVAHNFRLKGLRELIAAMPRVRAALPTVRLLVVGRDRADAYRAQAQRAGVVDAVEFLGSGAAMATLYRDSDVLVHPTWYDPCSRVVLEAIVRGLPAVTTAWNGAADAVRRFDAGAVIDQPTDIAALAEAIVRTAQRGPLSSEVVAAAQSELSMDRHARELVALYEELINLRQSGRKRR